jgi:hypothetical protein
LLFPAKQRTQQAHKGIVKRWVIDITKIFSKVKDLKGLNSMSQLLGPYERKK